MYSPIIITDNTKRQVGDFLSWLLCAALALSLVLGMVYAGYRLMFAGPECIKHHQQVEQVDNYGKKKAITVCDQFKGEPVNEG